MLFLVNSEIPKDMTSRGPGHWDIREVSVVFISEFSTKPDLQREGGLRIQLRDLGLPYGKPLLQKLSINSNPFHFSHFEGATLPTRIFFSFSSKDRDSRVPSLVHSCVVLPRVSVRFSSPESYFEWNDSWN